MTACFCWMVPFVTSCMHVRHFYLVTQFLVPWRHVSFCYICWASQSLYKLCKWKRCINSLLSSFSLSFYLITLRYWFLLWANFKTFYKEFQSVFSFFLSNKSDESIFSWLTKTWFRTRQKKTAFPHSTNDFLQIFSPLNVPLTIPHMLFKFH